MNGILFDRPPAWGKAWSLYGRRMGTDSCGDPIAAYNMETPDYSASAGSSGAVAWQVSEGTAAVTESGEQISATATGCIYDPSLAIVPFDRVQFDGAVWEVRAVDQWPSYRKVTVVRL
jgi:hypothetical protein